MAGPLWRPSEARVQAANLTRFRRFIEARGHRVAPGYEALWRWSVDQQAAFWSCLWDFCGVIGEPGDTVVEGLERMPGCRYFPDGRLNFAENLLRRRDSAPAIISRSEDGHRRTVTWSELYDQAGRVAAALRELGVEPGDRVVALVPNIPEAVAFMLGATAVGAALATASPDFGVDGIVDRFGQLEPVVLLAADGYRWAGKDYSVIEKVAAVRRRLETVRRVVVVPYRSPDPDVSRVHGAVSWDAFVGNAPHKGGIDFHRGAPDHALYVLFSSGTTGMPKCIVHHAGGVLLQHLKEHQLHCDIRAGDRAFYYTTCGWMMWNWLATCLASEATVLLYDGSPFHPGPEALFDFADEVGMTLMGVSAKYLDAARKKGLEPARTHDLGSLRSLLSTGSPLLADGFEYVYRHVKEDVHLASVSGGTDVCACFVGGVPTEPVWSGEIQGPALATAVAVYDEAGRPLESGKGELVCTAPIPSLPVGFVGDPDGSRYREAYFSRYPGVWHHGDFVERTEHGGYVIHGRSDATLNVHGVRIGTAEVYKPVEALAEVVEALVVAQEWDGDTRAVLFVRLEEGLGLDSDLEARIRGAIRSSASPRHVPARVVQVPDIPRTKSGKIVELAVREVVHGRPVGNLEALANPEALAWFADLAELGS